MGRRVFAAEFKHEAVKLVLERGVALSQASKDLGLHVNVLRKWVNDAKTNGAAAFPGRGKQRPDDAEVSRLRRELAKTKAERDVLKKATATRPPRRSRNPSGTGVLASAFPGLRRDAKVAESHRLIGACEVTGERAALLRRLLNGEIFYTLREAQFVIEQWRQHYNRVRPHSALGYRTPAPTAARLTVESRIGGTQKAA